MGNSMSSAATKVGRRGSKIMGRAFSSAGNNTSLQHGQVILRLQKNPQWAPNGVMDYARSVRRYKIQPTPCTPLFYNHEQHVVSRRTQGEKHFPSVSAATAPKMTGSSKVNAEDIQNDLEYVCPVTIGTPGTTLKLDFDTGSADLWVWSSEFRTSPKTAAQHAIYNPSKSNTSKKAPGLTWNIRYGDGSAASGDVYNDITRIGNVAISNQAVELASRLSQSFLGPGSDGLLGLAFPQINTVKLNGVPKPQKTPMQNMIESGLIAKPLFTAKLDKQDSNGFYTFGFIDTSVTSSPMNYTSVDQSNGFWEFPSTTFKIGNTVHQRSSGNTAIADTGTTLILLDDAAVEALYGSIPGAHLDPNQGGYVLPTESNVPDLSFSVGRYLYKIPGDDLKFADAGRGMSFGGIQSRGQNPQDILGDVFLKRVYVVFEQTQSPRIGVAQRSD